MAWVAGAPLQLTPTIAYMKLSTPFLLLSGTVLGALAIQEGTGSLSIHRSVLPSGGPYTASSSTSLYLPTTTGSQTTPLPTSITSTTITTSTTGTTSTTSTSISTVVSTTSTTTSPLPSYSFSSTTTGPPTSSSGSPTSSTTSSRASSGALSMKGLEDCNHVMATLLASLLFFL
ncbi:hypothetical protein K443DRAFT_685367 [Laccaria amethystina LaAM-08-1]|uniref:Uncharacterized protein n=1 Tax=Laccaria amethystina LaAM-08-1 TaxID=1095629 RepID=A0A0C9WI41_9AGAR|nr:hypothetical protein K443DRAFT_685367 [Laccaria amethystina LaAM-08-1]